MPTIPFTFNQEDAEQIARVLKAVQNTDGIEIQDRSSTFFTLRFETDRPYIDFLAEYRRLTNLAVRKN